MISLGRTYTYRRSATISTAITVLQIAAATGKPLWIVRAWANQASSTTSAQFGLGLVRKTAAATVTAAVAGDIVRHNPGDAAHSLQLGTALTGHTATAEGTDGEIPWSEGGNVLSGIIYLPVPEERIVVPAGGIIGLKMLTAPASATFHIGVTFVEVG